MWRQHPVHKAHLLCLIGAELPCREEDFLDHSRPDEIRQPANALIAIAEAKLCGWNGKPAFILADAHVAGHGQAHAAADTVSLNHGDGRLREMEHRIIESLAGF